MINRNDRSIADVRDTDRPPPLITGTYYIKDRCRYVMTQFTLYA